eukprot:310671-Pyramimonas_sp.AAC.1
MRSALLLASLFNVCSRLTTSVVDRHWHRDFPPGSSGDPFFGCLGRVLGRPRAMQGPRGKY